MARYDIEKYVHTKDFYNVFINKLYKAQDYLEDVSWGFKNKSINAQDKLLPNFKNS
jgi:hypothetical protein